MFKPLAIHLSDTALETELHGSYLRYIRKCEGKGKVVPVIFLTEHHAMKAYLGSGGIAPRILDLDTRRR
jgi:hypothetical protein